MLTRDTWKGPWAGLPVAWTDDDQFDEQTYRGDVIRCCQAGVPGVYTGGTSGEFYAMEFDEFCRIARATVEECSQHGVPGMIGCSSTYTLGAQRRAAYAAEIGAAAIQVTLPFWMEVDPAGVVPFFRAVSAACGHLPLSIYETTRCKSTLSLEQHRQLHEQLPNYLMVKSNAQTLGSSPRGCAALSRFVNVFVGENQWATLGPRGARGGCSSLVYWNPRVCLSLWNTVEQQQWDEARRQTEPLGKLFDFLHDEFGSRGFTDTAYDRLGGLASGFLRTSLRSRGPYRCVSPADIDTLRTWYQQEFPGMLVL